MRSRCLIPDEGLHDDDEFEFRELVSFFLKRQGDFEVDAVESAKEVRLKKSVAAVEYPLVMRGESRFLEARVVPMIGDQAFVVVREITNRKNYEKALRQANEKLNLLGHVPDMTP